ncbi:rhodanese-like domain-containing protein [Uliginosibacterium sp. H1]|uniref:rhodanese-like domain-containing protein n=1 Tax=Uliginosibacterium sp. H1 TaxID=3114757 RepID=UPI002E18A5C1|nr:rhodanese-like domain-containing protein [Uliginosibacterium sp. H1]
MEFLTHNVFWIVMALVSGGMLLAPMFRGGGRYGVSPAQAVTLINREDAAVLDVREAAEFERGHLPNARHIPLGELEKRADELNKLKNKPVIVVCQSGNRSGSARGILAKLGFERAVNLDGGVDAWAQASQPLVKGRK